LITTVCVVIKGLSTFRTSTTVRQQLVHQTPTTRCQRRPRFNPKISTRGSFFFQNKPVKLWTLLEKLKVVGGNASQGVFSTLFGILVQQSKNYLHI